MKRAVILFGGLLAALPVAAATAQVPPINSNISASERPAFLDSLEQADRDRYQQLEGASQARQALEAYGRCTAQRNHGEASRVLGLDFTSSQYRTGLRMLSREAERRCAEEAVGNGQAMRSGNLLFAGAVAEALIEDDSTPLNVRLVQNAATEAQTYSPTDAVAMCLARSLPDQVAAMFAATPDSEDETQAIAPLMQAVPACAQAVGLNAQLELSVPALRAMIATASYRLLSSSGDSDA